MKLTGEKIEYFKTKLQEEKGLLEDELSRVGKKNPNVPGDWDVSNEAIADVPDNADLAKSFEELDNRVAIEDSLEERLMQVNAALKKIETGNYGICENCDKSHNIDERRLEANPAANTCIEHAEN